ncbi:hypothetical protein A5682_02575 [Mycobacterium mantenii]|uniref:Uncharacterized protein n=1 Tax=Mycobacterium mantenii TaxID=560555 RepID=A0A1A2SSG4_MYCNT|nr:hypothetical protein A5688_02805 [Mycobacterium mantenii]OBH61081.1 hypothetical protein A5687_18075 [Mycobacterium mantenii]OBH67045.1 hypothetical protein A5683_09880 [Mycobacterium mantenii]OBH74683.1 hypothetical protein A5682_02575 [Mycobacterium mantenii]
MPVFAAAERTSAGAAIFWPGPSGSDYTAHDAGPHDLPDASRSPGPRRPPPAALSRRASKLR